jgi:hypothetical protein
MAVAGVDPDQLIRCPVKSIKPPKPCIPQISFREFKGNAAYEAANFFERASVQVIKK